MSREIVAVLPGIRRRRRRGSCSSTTSALCPSSPEENSKGILTDRDIVIRCVAAGKQPDSVKASELMTRDVAFVTPDQTVHDAVRMMAAEQVRRLPVVSNGFIDGMVSLADIARRHAGPRSPRPSATSAPRPTAPVTRSGRNSGPVRRRRFGTRARMVCLQSRICIRERSKPLKKLSGIIRMASFAGSRFGIRRTGPGLRRNAAPGGGCAQSPAFAGDCFLEGDWAIIGTEHGAYVPCERPYILESEGKAA